MAVNELSKELACAGITEEKVEQAVKKSNHQHKSKSNDSSRRSSRRKSNSPIKITHIHPELTLEQVQMGSGGQTSSSKSKRLDSNEDLEINTMFDLHSRLGLRY